MHGRIPESQIHLEQQALSNQIDHSSISLSRFRVKHGLLSTGEKFELTWSLHIDCRTCLIFMYDEVILYVRVQIGPDREKFVFWMHFQLSLRREVLVRMRSVNCHGNTRDEYWRMARTGLETHPRMCLCADI